MESGLSQTLEQMRRARINSPDDEVKAQRVSKEIQDLADEQVAAIDAYTNLYQIGTLEDEARIRSALISLRHLYSAVRELSHWHEKNRLNEVWGTRLHHMQLSLRKAETQAAALLRFGQGPLDDGTAARGPSS